MNSRHLSGLLAIALASTVLMGCQQKTDDKATSNRAGGSYLLDDSAGRNWAAYGRTYGEQHYSPLTNINAGNIGELGLAWSYDLPPGNPMSGPIAVDGILYTSTGYAVIRAFDAATGKLLWTFDPEAPQASGRKLRQGWGSRGLAWWNGKIYLGTQDGRLIALDAKTGQEIWSAMTVEKDDYRFISGAPRVFDGKIIIGHGGADAGNTRGYVTTYDAETGKQLWRFYTVPGNPADGFENETMEMAARTWAGEWWKQGGGGTVWNTMTYDPDTNSVFIGVGNGAPWNHRARSQGEGDNLFLASIVALDADTGAYKWHYQVNPGETWDYNAAMDMHLADLNIDGEDRKVLMQMPKNGFFYVIDRVTGKLISAEPVARVNWASKIDLETGRPVENPAARYPDGSAFVVRPSPVGAHGWLPSAYSPDSRLVYLPVIEQSWNFSDAAIDTANYRRPAGNVADGAVMAYGVPPEKNGPEGSSFLIAWNPVTQKEAWRVETGGPWSGGILATGGKLVFQGKSDASFNAYDAATGERIWQFAAQAPVLAPPISYMVGNEQYVTVLAGLGTSSGIRSELLPFPVDYYTQARRILTFRLGGTATIPQAEPYVFKPFDDPTYKVNRASAERGGAVFAHCLVCHGIGAASGGIAPDLRAAQSVLSADTFATIVRDGGLIPNAMPQFEELTDAQLADLRQYIRAQAAEAR